MKTKEKQLKIIEDAFNKHYSGSIKLAKRREQMIADKTATHMVYNQFARDFEKDGYTDYGDSEKLFSKHSMICQEEIEDIFNKDIEPRYKDVNPVKPEYILEYLKKIMGIKYGDMSYLLSYYYDGVLYIDEPVSPFYIHLGNNWTDVWELEDLDNVMEELGYFRETPDIGYSCSFKMGRYIRYYPYSKPITKQESVSI